MRIIFQIRWESNAEKAGGVVWPGRWQRFQAWAVPTASRPTSEGSVRVRLALAACSDQGGGGVVRHGRWQRNSAWALPAASGLAVAVRIWSGTVVSFSQVV